MDLVCQDLKRIDVEQVSFGMREVEFLMLLLHIALRITSRSILLDASVLQGNEMWGWEWMEVDIQVLTA